MITQAQRTRRMRGIGSSEAAAVLGLDKYRGPADVQAEKLGIIDRPDISSDVNSPAWIGNQLEPSILSGASEIIGAEIHKKNTERVHPQHGFLRANVDAWTENGSIVEAKSVGLLSRVVGEEWGEERTDEVPDRVLIQVHHQMLVTGAPFAYVVALLSGRGFVIYDIPRNDALIQAIETALVDWWKRHVEEAEPVGEPYSLETLSLIERVQGEAVEINSDLFAKFDRAREAVKSAEKERDEAKAELLSALDKAEIGTADGWKLKYAQRSRTSLDSKSIKKDHPEVYEKYTKTSVFRVADVRRVKQMKGDS